MKWRIVIMATNHIFRGAIFLLHAFYYKLWKRYSVKMLIIDYYFGCSISQILLWMWGSLQDHHVCSFFEATAVCGDISPEQHRCAAQLDDICFSYSELVQADTVRGYEITMAWHEAGGRQKLYHAVGLAVLPGFTAGASPGEDHLLPGFHLQTHLRVPARLILSTLMIHPPLPCTVIAVRVNELKSNGSSPWLITDFSSSVLCFLTYGSLCWMWLIWDQSTSDSRKTKHFAKHLTITMIWKYAACKYAACKYSACKYAACLQWLRAGDINLFFFTYLQTTVNFN